MKYFDEKNQLVEIICNQCGKKTKVENDLLKDEWIHIQKAFGYFSDRDGEISEIDLCEDCYEKLCADLIIPATVRKNKELL